MATVLKFGTKQKLLRAQLDPALKEFLDEMLIPSLVKKYIRDNRLAPMPSNVRKSAERDATPTKENQ